MEFNIDTKQLRERIYDICSQPRTIICLVGILYVSLVSLGISDPYDHDEIITLEFIASDTLDQVVQKVAEDVHTPLYFISLWLWTNLFNSHQPLVTRSLSAVYGAISIFLLYTFLKTYYSSKSALFTSTVFATSHVILFYNQQIRPYSLLILLVIASSYFYRKYERLKNIATLAWYTCVNVAIVYTHVLGALVLFAHMCYAAENRLRQTTSVAETIKDVLPLVASYLTVGFSLLPWVHEIMGLVSDPRLSWLPQVSLDTLAITYKILFTSPVLIGLTIILAINADWSSDSFLIYWAVIPVIVLSIFSLTIRPALHSRYLLSTVPALYALIPIWVRRIDGTTLKVLISVLIIGLFAISAFHNVELTRIDYEPLLEPMPDGNKTVLSTLTHGLPARWELAHCDLVQSKRCSNFTSYYYRELGNGTFEIRTKPGKLRPDQLTDQSIWLIIGRKDGILSTFRSAGILAKKSVRTPPNRDVELVLYRYSPNRMKPPYMAENTDRNY